MPSWALEKAGLDWLDADNYNRVIEKLRSRRLLTLTAKNSGKDPIHNLRVPAARPAGRAHAGRNPGGANQIDWAKAVMSILKGDLADNNSCHGNVARSRPGRSTGTQGWIDGCRR
jgi:hypothetical protein